MNGSASGPGREALSLAGGEALELSYRILLHAGRLDAKRLEEERDRFESED